MACGRQGDFERDVDQRIDSVYRRLVATIRRSAHSVRPVLGATCNFDGPVAVAGADCGVAVAGAADVAVAVAFEKFRKFDQKQFGPFWMFRKHRRIVEREFVFELTVAGAVAFHICVLFKSVDASLLTDDDAEADDVSGFGNDFEKLIVAARLNISSAFDVDMLL